MFFNWIQGNELEKNQTDIESMKTIKCRLCKIPMQFRVAPLVNARCLCCSKCGWFHEWRDRGALIDVQLRIAGLRDDEWAALGYLEPRELPTVTQLLLSTRLLKLFKLNSPRD